MIVITSKCQRAVEVETTQIIFFPASSTQNHLLNLLNKSATNPMVNYNMGMYYAWTNFKQLVQSTIRKYRSPPNYQYSYIAPRYNPRAQIVPYHEWKGNRQREQSQFNLKLMAIAFICCFLSRTTYLILYDDYMGYYYQTRYPVLSRSVELIHEDVQQFFDPFLEIMPRNRYEIPQVLPRLYELVVQKENRIAEHDRKVVELKKQMQEYDKRTK